MPASALLWASQAWLPGGWQQGVLLEAGADGLWSHVATGVSTPPERAQRLAGPALPGLVNAHSHAFQRAFAGLTERRERDSDDFWGWRERLYRIALRIEPAQMQAIATQLYIELMRGGYTHVCEFHYLQHRPDGSTYQDPREMSWALAAACAETGMQLTLLPTLYERSGFELSALAPAQRRFRADADQAWAMQAAIAARHAPGVRAGLAIHSLRAASPASIARLRELAAHFDGPIHIHMAEQSREVDQCLSVLGARPIEWLASQPGGLDRRWQLVHATHATPAEIELVAASGAGVVLCPSTGRTWATGCPTCPRGWRRMCRSRSARTARSRAAGARNCAGSNTASGSPDRRAISEPRPCRGSLRPRRACTSACCEAARPRPAMPAGVSKRAPAPTCWCWTAPTSACSASRIRTCWTRWCSPVRGGCGAT